MKPQNFSKKINIIVAVLVLLAGMSIGGYLVLESRTSQANLLEQMAQNLNDQDIIDDLDHDGLAGWEENLHKTDSNNPDTDGDGYLDGEEVAAGYDPTKPAPDDKLGSDNNQNTDQPIRPEPGNLTQMLGYILSNQMMFDDPLSLDRENIASLEDTLQQVADEKVIEALQKASAGFLAEFRPDFQESQLKISDNNSPEAIKNYIGQMRDKIGMLDSCQNINNLKSDIDFITEAINTKNFEQVNCQVLSYFQGYQTIKEITVPLSWLNFHKKALTIFWNLSKVYQAMPKFENDPLKGLIALEKFKQSSEDLVGLMNEMKILLETYPIN